MAREIQPTNVERPFDLDELFFSTTDQKGIIRSGNRVFTRVSGFTEAELIRRPHNIIRHPTCPVSCSSFCGSTSRPNAPSPPT